MGRMDENTPQTFNPRTFATSYSFPYWTNGPDETARRGIALTRDAAHLAVASLRRDAYDARIRGAVRAADEMTALANSINSALVRS